MHHATEIIFSFIGLTVSMWPKTIGLPGGGAPSGTELMLADTDTDTDVQLVADTDDGMGVLLVCDEE